MDRPWKLPLPVIDICAGLESYLETKARAEELEEKIETTGEWEGHDVVKWTGKEVSDEY